MKELEDPIAGNLLCLRYDTRVIGTIKDVFTENQILKVRIEWIPYAGLELEPKTEDHAYPFNMPNIPNYYIYYDCKDTPQNRLVLQLRNGS